MVLKRVGRIGTGTFNAVFRPAEFVAAPAVTQWSSVRDGIGEFGSLLSVYVANVLLYATPLTLAGFGLPTTEFAPPVVAALVSPVLGDPDTVWRLAVGIGQNSAFLTALSAVTLFSYHAVLVCLRRSRGFSLTLHTVVYSVSVYLAGIFTIVVFLTQSRGYQTAAALVREVQIRFISILYDAFAIPTSHRVFRPASTVSAENLSNTELLALAVLGVLVLYFLYSLYLGTKLNHRADSMSALISTGAVALSPALYVSALLVYSTGGL